MNSFRKLSLWLSVLLGTTSLVGHFIYQQSFIAETLHGNTFIFKSALLQGMFIVPLLLSMSLAGFISDKYPKEKVIRVTSLILALFIGAAATSILFGLPEISFYLSLGIGFAYAFQSPAKFGILKEFFGVQKLSTSNSIIMGISLLSALAAGVGTSFYLSYCALAGISFVAFLVSLFLPKTRPTDALVKFRSLNFFKFQYFKRNLRTLFSNSTLFSSVIGLSIFWALTQMLVILVQGSTSPASIAGIQYRILVAGIGLLLGSITAGFQSRHFIETGLLPIGAFLASICMILIPFFDNQTFSLCLYGLLGFAGGWFIIPLNALIQYNSKPSTMGHLWSAANWCQAMVLLLFLGLDWAILKFGILTQEGLFLVLGAISFVGFLISIRMAPQTLVRPVIKAGLSSRYRLQILGLENIPSEGPVLLAGNHLSYIDWAILMVACPRPLRVVMTRDHFERWYVSLLLNRLSIIKLDRDNPEPALTEINKALKNGKAVVTFPEGQVSRSAQVGPFLIPHESALKDTGASLIPFYMQGLWGSTYSFAKGGFFNSLRSARFRNLTIHFGTPVANDISSKELRRIVQDLSIEAWKSTIATSKPIASSWLYTAKKIGSGPVVFSADSQMSSYKLLGLTTAFSKKLKPILKGEQNIGLMLPTSGPGIIINFALWMLGKTNSNLNFTNPPDVIEICATRADIKTIISSRLFFDKLKLKGNDFYTLQNKFRILFMEDIASSVPKWKFIYYILRGMVMPAKYLELMDCKKVKLSDVAMIMFSSGSEGNPKGVELTHANVMGNVRQISALLNLGKEDVMMASLPIFHAFGLTVCVVMSLIVGTPIVAHPDPTDLKTIAKLVARFKVTHLIATNTFFRGFATNKNIHPLMFDSLRYVIAGAEKLRTETRDLFFKKFGIVIYEGFGATETTPGSSMNDKDILLDDLQTVQVRCKHGTVGMPIPGTQYRIVDPETNKDLPVGEEGMVLIGGVQIMKGYLKDPERTRNAVIEKEGLRWYRTGDKGKVDEDGFLTIVDRYSRFAKLGGEMVSLGAVEGRIFDSHLFEGEECIAVPAPDKVKGEQIILFYVGAKSEDEVLKILRGFLPPLMQPSRIVKIDAIPRLGNGKVDYEGAKKTAKEIIS
jgi:acyl-[acyl-carrier-protein]-phospholipid O-acyltransferase / long-chain-fatty-acid--[acyl-carrier-protein] ligase